MASLATVELKQMDGDRGGEEVRQKIQLIFMFICEDIYDSFSIWVLGKSIEMIWKSHLPLSPRIEIQFEQWQ